MRMRTTGLVALAAGATLVLSACAGGAASQSKPAGGATAAPAKTEAKAAAKGNPTQGQTLFAQSCSACHGADAKGLPGLGKDMTTSVFIKDQNDQQLIDFIKRGRPVSDPANTTKVDMPPKGGNPALTDAQLADIVAYIRTLAR
jgi:disulfide bond formation protein DsbB